MPCGLHRAINVLQSVLVAPWLFIIYIQGHRIFAARYSPKVRLRDVIAGDKAAAAALLEREGLELVSGIGVKLDVGP